MWIYHKFSSESNSVQIKEKYAELFLMIIELGPYTWSYKSSFLKHKNFK
jgi:hypothetical protein